MPAEDLTCHAQGYLHPLYATSLSEFGRPRRLPRSGGWILERPIPDTPFHDAMGCYPLFCCEEWGALKEDLSDLEGELVSLALVADPFGEYTVEGLRQTFGSVVRPFKEHHVIDLRGRPLEFVASHHLRNARKALRTLRVEAHQAPTSLAEDWTRLYATLITRHGLTGVHRFSSASFERQLSVPGCTALAARFEGTVVGMLLWYEQGNVAYYHLGAFSPEGYERGASFALFYTALGYFADAGLRWLDLGGGAGLEDRPDDGLARFKRGWATGTRPAYLCGTILDPGRYSDMISSSSHSTYFPQYRLQGGG
jgi:hypothetical protein